MEPHQKLNRFTGPSSPAIRRAAALAMLAFSANLSHRIERPAKYQDWQLYRTEGCADRLRTEGRPP
jgi:hypothetical protein